MRILHPSLILLLRLHFVAFFRRMVREMKTVRGAIVMMVYALMTLWWIPFFFLGMNSGEFDSKNLVPWLEQNPDLAHQIPGAVLLAFTLASVVLPQRMAGIRFKPSDVDFLFAGPYLRRELITFKIGIVLLGLIPGSLFFAFIGASMTSMSLLNSFLGMSLSFTWLYLFPVSVSMFMQSASTRLHTPIRAGVTIVLLTTLAISAFYFLSRANVSDLTSPAAVAVLNVLIIPFKPFAEVLTARTFTAETLLWAGVAAAMNATLFANIIVLDADYREAGLKQTRDLQERLGRLRKGGSPLAMFRARQTRHSLPQFPRLAGSGAIAWRQITTAQRQTPKPLYLVLAYVLYCYAIYVLGRVDISLLGVLSPLLIMTIFILPQWVRFDFRGDFHKMNWLKSLPFPSWGITLGQLVTPVLVATLFYVAVLAPVAVIAQQWILLPLIFVLVPLLAGVLFAIENLIFLLMPSPAVPTTPGDFRFIVQMWIGLLFKTTILFVFVGVAGGAAGLAYWLTGMFPLAAVLAAMILIGEGALLLLGVALAFDRLDISKMPPA